MQAAPETQLQMLRPNLDGLPEVHLPPEVTVRTATPADAEPLAAVLELAFTEGNWTADRAIRDLLAADDVDSTWVLERNGQLLATCSCQNKNRPGTLGTLHWVAADPAASGMRLGYWACLVALQEFARTGYKACNLTTDDPRLPAIKTYFALGFEPEYVAEDHPDRWAKVQMNLGR
jgi:mycothiol synthase